MAGNKELEQQLRLHMQSLIKTQQIQGADYCVTVEHRIAAKGRVGAVPPITEIQSITMMYQLRAAVGCGRGDDLS